ncbi:MAG: PspA/IM30 family protein [Cellvibrionaceae bacterium]
MNVWAKMITALKGGVNEAGEAIVDTQALRILDQEVRDAGEELKQSKDGLATIMARQKLSEEKVKKIESAIQEHEGYAVKALEADNEALALEVATKIADLENQLDDEKKLRDGFTENVNKLRETIRQTELTIKRLKQQVDTVKATENVQRAQAAVAERHSGTNSKLRTAMDSLERLKEKQTLKDAQMKVANELSEENVDSSLKNKLEEAGITSSTHKASDVLERIKKSRAEK